MKRLLVIAIAVGLTSCSARWASRPPDKFLAEVLQDGIAEIQDCRLALSISQNEEVKQFAQFLIAEHTRLDAQINAIAARRGMDLPQQPNDKQKGVYASLSLLSGAAFDQQFIRLTSNGHESELKTLDSFLQSAPNDEVKTLAASALETAKKHLQITKDLAQRVAPQDG